VSEIDEWLQANADALASIADETEFEARLVHLVAVLVLAGLDDETIHGQLVGLMEVLNGHRSPLEGEAAALDRIRYLAHRHGRPTATYS